jgi:hypothetical protein
VNIKKLFLYLSIASVALSALIGIVVILFGNFGELESKVLLTTLTVTVTSILGLACGAYLESGRGRILPLAGIMFAVVTFAMWLIVIWAGSNPPGSSFMEITMSATLLAAACSHLSLLSLATLAAKFQWTQTAAAVLIWLATALIFALIWANLHDYEGTIGRVLGVLGILVATVTILTPVLHRLSGTDDGSDIDAEMEKLKSRIAMLEEKKAALIATK